MIMKKIIILFIILLWTILSSCVMKQKSDINSVVKEPVIVEPVLNEQVLPTSCIDENEGGPLITSISTNSWTIDTKIKIEWCNFSGFEWDKHLWIENEKGIKWLLYSEEWSSSKQITITLKSPLCQFDTSYSGLECNSFLELIPWKYKIYVMPWWKVSNKIDFTIIYSQITSDLSYQDIIDYLDKNITEIITSYSTILPTNWKWFADWFWFTSINNVYVDYEDGHYLYRALLECHNPNNILSCNPLAIFEKQKSWWLVIQWENTQKNNNIIYKWAKDYEWER